MNRPACLLLPCLPLLLLFVGCSKGPQSGSGGPWQPIRHPTVNAVPATQRPTSQPSAKGDTTVVATLVSHREYAQEPTDDRRFRRHWYLTTFHVVRVEQGTWPHEEVSLITDSVWPTPESGIVIDVGPDWRIPPRYPAVTWALHLDTTVKPAKLVGYQERSLVPPHDKPPVDLDDADPKMPHARRVEYEKQFIPQTDAFMAALAMAKGRDYVYGRTEQTNAAFVVQTVSRHEDNGHRSVWTIQIDKKTGKGTLLWSIP